MSDSVLSKLFDACACELTRLDGRATDLLDESDPSLVDELLSEYESELGLASDGTIAERQARVLAQALARPRYRPADLQTALGPLLGQSGSSVVVIEISHAVAVTMGDVREIYRFYIFRDPNLPGAYFLDSAQELLDQIKPSHTAGHVIESASFLCDDPFSLTNRDILGA